MIQFDIARNDLLKALSHVQNVVERRQTIPILANVLLSVKDNKLTLRATDNEIEISDKVDLLSAEEGEITVSAHKLYEVVKKLSDGAMISCSMKDNLLMVSSGRSRFSLPTLPTDGFPIMNIEDASVTFKLTAAEILSLIERTVFAVSTEETRYNLNGIYLHTTEKELKAVATDGHRLANAFVNLPEGASSMAGVIIPRKTIGEMMKLIAEYNQDVVLSVSQNQIRFSVGDVVLSSRLLDGQYPEYEKVIPTNNDKTLTVDSNLLTTVVDRVAVVSEKSRGIKIQLSKGKMVLSSSNADEGSASDEIEVGYDDETMEIGFNYRYLLDILSNVKGSTVQCSLSSPTAPVIIEDANDKTALYVLMPMRV